MSVRFEDLPGLIPCRLEPPGLSGQLGPSAIDTRKLNPGELFWALKGQTADGHDYIEDAFRKGAQAVVVEEDWFQSRKDSLSSGAFVVVKDTLSALQNLAKAHRERFRIPVIALTGSNGKTATKEYLAAALGLQYNILKSPGNFNNFIGVPLTLLQFTEETDMVVVEMGTSQPGDIHLLCEIAKPDHGLLINVAPAHLEGFGDLDGVAAEKGKLLTSLPPTGAAFVNCDDPRVRRMKSTAGIRVCFGFNAELAEADCCRMVCAENLGLTAQGRGCFQLRNVTFNLNWYGRHQVQNALAAVAVADHFGIPLNEMADLFASMPPIKGRLNLLEIGGVKLIDDTYNANPASTAAALSFLKSLPVPGKRYAVLGDHLELGKDSQNQHRRIGKLIGETDLTGVFLIGPEMRHAREEIPERVCFYLADPVNLQPVLAEIIRVVQPGDALLVKGSRGMRLERIVEGLISHFNKGQS